MSRKTVQIQTILSLHVFSMLFIISAHPRNKTCNTSCLSSAADVYIADNIYYGRTEDLLSAGFHYLSLTAEASTLMNSTSSLCAQKPPAAFVPTFAGEHPH
jgi:hypothetical protein